MTTGNALAPVSPLHPKGSIAGFVISIFSLIASGIGTGLVHAHFKPAPATTSKVANQVAAGTGHVVGSLISIPFLTVGIALAIIAALFVLIRLGKRLGIGGIIFSIISLLICIWSFSLAVDAFRLLKAH